MTAQSWLEGVRLHAMNLDVLARELSVLEEAERECLAWSPRGKGTPRKGSCGDPTASTARARMEGLALQISAKARELAESERVVGDCLRALAVLEAGMGRRHRLAIEVYYVDCASTWSEVACEIGVTVRHVRRLRDAAFAWLDDYGVERLIGMHC